MATFSRLVAVALLPAPVPFLPALQTCQNPLKSGHHRTFTLLYCRSQASSGFPDDGIREEQPNVGKHVVEAEKMRNERGVQFFVGSSFYREESAVGRDLACLAAAVYKKDKGRLHVLDALSGCGIRAARYLAHAQADFVWANDACDALDTLMAHNLSLASSSSTYDTDHSGQPSQELDSYFSTNFKDENGRWQVTTQDANKVLLDCYIRKNYFDLIDVDSFGSDSVFLGSALSALSYGGLIYATSTDGFSSGGHRPCNALASYGAYIRPMTFANEIGLRMLIGGVVREAALRNLHVYPVFSHYSFHGPVFRVMLRVLPSNQFLTKDYNFIAFCHKCGETEVVKWSSLGRNKCSCVSSSSVSSRTLNGPLWTGPLHSTDDVKNMTEMAKSWGWIEGDLEPAYERRRSPPVSTKDRNLKKLLSIMLEESNPDLQVGYIELDQISMRSKGSTPKRDDLIVALHQEGYAASRSHVQPNAIKTNCPLGKCVEISQSTAPQR
ncbi:tRNA (guanine(26)-N(2))-dimethyltransferase [Physcomitrium patens]|uniref:tRNA (guanine(26)-N(2))-dimethyltransferase n=1 Tax=Physcomitrium patens TaxID=3218 RepID=A0A2K1IMH6_PHYPA|nr:tRNA (guanine(26)-N(2))-dimethyltransferase-like [Physcomitrium patens]XP_024360107.1 tRNA (guanine(26)-N(2))-dimethyltransferase-like [Physcomitrium patens]XP_024360108.1 tRNA (guanine(26)-N(2))-dimethyltransferase-like [Physcomitrium patens]XP_024360109.1 tRNA (guanine(26)-N(2))-dimethyltransferase-like [Physcomitrium patens]PNR30473.1 hypothetical protein PHYPA_026789 [Physcomitrium patens]|eukprot:XP_024360106.1 tRNA (guanine(26)-N(2))-dimethyltransferase-like [Physcomitrella patens]